MFLEHQPGDWPRRLERNLGVTDQCLDRLELADYGFAARCVGAENPEALLKLIVLCSCKSLPRESEHRSLRGGQFPVSVLTLDSYRPVVVHPLFLQPRF